MGSHRFFRREFVSASLSVGALLVVGLQGLLPLAVSAAEVTDSSITLSSSVEGDTNVTYKVTFTPSTTEANGAYILDFCDNSAVIDASCTAPAGFSVASAASTTTGVTSVGELNSSASTLEVVQPLTAGTPVTDEITGINNPNYVTDSDTGFYARLVTYDTEADASSYTATGVTPGSGGAEDTGGYALSISSGIGVSGTVLESMLFCVASATITENCANASDNLPNVVLGGAGGDLDASSISTGNIYTQISTNALTGAVVDLKSGATGCGGLELDGSESSQCIPAASTAPGFNTYGTADFGVETGSSYFTASSSNPIGELEAAGGTNYNSSDYYLSYSSNNTSGVTSPYGDPILDTDGAAANNANNELTFGATVSPNTPAGNYSADLQMIATGTF